MGRDNLIIIVIIIIMVIITIYCYDIIIAITVVPVSVIRKFEVMVTVKLNTVMALLKAPTCESTPADSLFVGSFTGPRWYCTANVQVSDWTRAPGVLHQ